MRLGRFGRAAIMVGVILAIAAASVSYTRSARRASVRAGLFAEIQSVKLKNCEMKRFGEPNDGGYLACANLLQGAKATYSYGINGYDGWGCDASRHLSVTTHQYDCFNTAEPTCPGGSTRFHAECIGPRKTVEDGRPFDTLESQLRANGDAGNHVIVKMDVEGAEWDALRNTSADVLDR